MLFVSIGVSASEEPNLNTHKLVTLPNGKIILVRKTKVRSVGAVYAHRSSARLVDEKGRTPLSLDSDKGFSSPSSNGPEFNVVQQKKATPEQSVSLESQSGTEALAEYKQLPFFGKARGQSFQDREEPRGSFDSVDLENWFQAGRKKKSAHGAVKRME